MHKKQNLGTEKKVMLTHSKLINTLILIFNYLPICRYMISCVIAIVYRYMSFIVMFFELINNNNNMIDHQ